MESKAKVLTADVPALRAPAPRSGTVKKTSSHGPDQPYEHHAHGPLEGFVPLYRRCDLSATCEITVYDQEYFQGKRMEFTSCCQNIMECGMENIRSLKVECGSWVGFEHSSFCGQQFVLEKGDYPRFEAYSGSNSLPHREDDLLQAHLLCCSHKESRMTIYEKENMVGRQFELCNDYPSLQAMGWMNNEVGSMHVQCGAFVCYQYPGYRGHQYIMECECHGGEYKCYRQFGSHAQTPQIQSIRRIQH
ncbi:Beta-crystallin A1 [Merluccius polli]|uniref:Beta-crystallin A1 n=1 Tax=Merluccius polli TaxID=89951 RepID=A0AA47P712_MERPO|nr:Beta-crystallin A1 [Merluccius polli]